MVRLVHEECVLWVAPLQGLTQQALSTRLRMLPAAFLQVLLEPLPGLAKRSLERSRPLPAELAWGEKAIHSGLRLRWLNSDALLCKVGLLQENEKNPLAGR
ncbi:MAG: hypothetical protein U0175_05030 [Caldilineaceae bacterium]